MTVVELRCPTHHRMFGKALAQKPVIVEGNLVEFACRDCRRDAPGIREVFHRFNMAGELVETEIVT